MDMDVDYVEINPGEMPAIEVERSITTHLETKILWIEDIEDKQTIGTIGRSSFQLEFERGCGEELFMEVESVVNS